MAYHLLLCERRHPGDKTNGLVPVLTGSIRATDWTVSGRGADVVETWFHSVEYERESVKRLYVKYIVVKVPQCRRSLYRAEERFGLVMVHTMRYFEKYYGAATSLVFQT